MPKAAYNPPPNLSELQFDVLTAVAVDEPRWFSEIVGVTHLSGNTVSAVLTRLVRSGMVRRFERRDGRRRVAYEMTPFGNNVLSLYAGGLVQSSLFSSGILVACLAASGHRWVVRASLYDFPDDRSLVEMFGGFGPSLRIPDNEVVEVVRRLVGHLDRMGVVTSRRLSACNHWEFDEHPLPDNWRDVLQPAADAVGFELVERPGL